MGVVFSGGGGAFINIQLKTIYSVHAFPPSTIVKQASPIAVDRVLNILLNVALNNVLNLLRNEFVIDNVTEYIIEYGQLFKKRKVSFVFVFVFVCSLQFFFFTQDVPVMPRLHLRHS